MRNTILIFSLFALTSAAVGLRLSDLLDVSTPAPTNADILTYNGRGWIAQALTIPVGGSLFKDGTTVTDGAVTGRVIAEAVDASAEITVQHDLGENDYTVQVTGTGATPYVSSITSRTDTTFKVKFWSVDSVFVAVPNTTPVSFDWIARVNLFRGLTDIATAPLVAFSTRQLTNTYTGPLVRVRRSTDNAEADFYADLNRELSSNSESTTGEVITDFVGAGDGFVVTWYDQSGNENNATQATTTLQPRIIIGGNMVVQGSKIAFDFDGTDDFLLFNTVNSSITTSISMVSKSDNSGSGNAIPLSDGSANYFDYKSTATNHRIRIAGANGDFAAASVTTHQAMFFGKNATNAQLWKNGALLGTLTTWLTAAPTWSTIGKWTTFEHNGTVQEVVIWETDKRSIRPDVIENVGTHFGL